MKIYTPNDKTTYKYIHEDLSKIKFNIIFHNMFIKGVNDNPLDVFLTKEIIKNIIETKIFDFIELRILRLNTCENSILEKKSYFK